MAIHHLYFKASNRDMISCPARLAEPIFPAWGSDIGPGWADGHHEHEQLFQIA